MLRNWLLELARVTMEREGSEDAAHDYDHLVRVMALADTIQAHEGGDLPTIWAAVSLHDIGQARERRDGGDHAFIGAELAADLLTGTTFPQAAIPAVQQAIREHRMTGGVIPRTLEGRILYDAKTPPGAVIPGGMGVRRVDQGHAGRRAGIFRGSA